MNYNELDERESRQFVHEILAEQEHFGLTVRIAGCHRYSLIYNIDFTCNTNMNCGQLRRLS